MRVPEAYSRQESPLKALRDAKIRAAYSHIGVDVENGPYGEGIRIAVADSVGQPPDEFTGSVGECLDCRPNNATDQEPDEDAHGWDVARIIARALPEAEYDFYRSLNKPGENRDEFDVDDLIPPVKTAICNSVDVLNMSAGVDSKYGGHRSYERIVRKAAEHGTIVVAAAGNKKKIDRLAYPARAPSAIGVSGCVSYCDRQIIDEHLDDRRVWVGEPTYRGGPYCSSQGCHERTSCRHTNHEWWTGNVDPVGHKPDAAASAVHFTGRNTRPIRKGTSFAAPLVTGAIGRLVEEAGNQMPVGEDLAELIRRESRFLGCDLNPQANHDRQHFSMDEIREQIDCLS